MREITVVVVEAHNEALNHIYRAIGSKKIPFSGLKLFHFDSHPDMCLPKVSASLVKSNPMELLNNLHIENWIIPAVFAGHIDHVLWMHPKWANQLNNRHSVKYSVGVRKTTEELSVNIPEPYFINEGIFCSVDDMESPVPFGFTVADIHEANTLCKVCADIISILLNHAYVLDVDLDVFSTLNPFRKFYSKEQVTLIDRLFTPPRPPALTSVILDAGNSEQVFAAATLAAQIACEAWREQTEQLRDWMCILGTGVSLPLCEIVAHPYEIHTLCCLLRSLRETKLEKTDGEDVLSEATWAAIEVTWASAQTYVADLNNHQPTPTIQLEDALPKDEGFNATTSRVTHKPADGMSPKDNEELNVLSPQLTSEHRSLQRSVPPATKRRSVSPGPFHMTTRHKTKAIHTSPPSTQTPSVADVPMSPMLYDPMMASVVVSPLCLPLESCLNSELTVVEPSGDCEMMIQHEFEKTDKDDQAFLMHLHDLWCSISDQENDPLPHYVSSPKEQAELREHMESLLNRLHNPCLITISRSVADGYTPPDQITDIQLRFFQALDRIYGCKILSILLDYGGAEADAAILRAHGFKVSIRSEDAQVQNNASISMEDRCSTSDYRTEPGRREIV